MGDPFSASAIALACIPAVAGVVAGVIVYKLAPDTYNAIKESLITSCYEMHVCSLTQNPAMATNMLKFIASYRNQSMSSAYVNVCIDKDQVSVPMTLDVKVNNCWVNFMIKLNGQDEAVSITASTFKRHTSLFRFFAIDTERVQTFRAFIRECVTHVPLADQKQPVDKRRGQYTPGTPNNIAEETDGVSRLMATRLNTNQTIRRVPANQSHQVDDHLAVFFPGPSVSVSVF